MTTIAAHEPGSTPAVGEAPVFGLLGSPNAGKTTLFNALTGLRARVGNYPGVTVERREAALDLDGRRATLIDLPGTYGLAPISADEAVVEHVLAGRIEGVARPDALVLVADACSLPRSLPFLGDALRLERPSIVVLTMLDEPKGDALTYCASMNAGSVVLWSCAVAPVSADPMLKTSAVMYPPRALDV